MTDVLLVEDDNVLRYALERSLRAGGITVHAVGSAHAALGVLDGDGSVDVVVADIMLGDHVAHGISLAQMARLRRKGVGIVFITAYVEAVRHADAHGPILLKPVDPALLIQAIRNAVTMG